MSNLYGDENMSSKTISIFSQLFHLFKYKYENIESKYENGMLIFSIDVDVGNETLGTINKGKNDVYLHSILTERQIGKIEESAMPIFVNLYEEFDVPVTFALRGQLLELEDWNIDILRESSVDHDIGSHGYSHRDFKSISETEAEKELYLTSKALGKYNIHPKSFIFPKNRINHLNLLEKYGYEYFRDYGDYKKDGMYIKKYGNLYDIHPSLFIDKYTRPYILNKILQIAIKNKLPFHLWFHMWNFGFEKNELQKNIRKVLYPFLKKVNNYRKNDLLTIETMQSAVKKIS